MCFPGEAMFAFNTVPSWSQSRDETHWFDQGKRPDVAGNCLVCCFTSQSTAMIMSGRSIHLTKYFTLHKFNTGTARTDMSLLAHVKLRTGDFDNFWGVKFVLKFHMFIILLRVLPCEELVRFFSDVKNCMVLNFHKCEESVP